LPQADLIVKFLNTKRMCCCIPLGWGEGAQSLQDKYRRHPAKMQVAAVAVMDNRIVGFIQLILHGMPCDIHTCKPGEAYVYEVAVHQDARGCGVGTKLLNWSEETAKEMNCTYMSLDVLRGNRAIGLYERKGYRVQFDSLINSIFSLI
ncbi:unnamed protein product, partial [Heterosigma akashiwo]